MAFQFSNDRWFATGVMSGSPAARLVVFPYAGGGASAYFSWQSLLPADWQMVCVQLPGRENRFQEPPAESMQSLVGTLAQRLEPMLDRPTVCFGHSMGGWVAWEVIRLLGPAAQKNLQRLVVAASPAPDRPRAREDWLHDLPEPKLIERMRVLGGTPETVFRHREMLDLLLPVLRNDLRLFETVLPHSEPLLTCPVVAIAGRDDPQIPPHRVAAWQSLTLGPFEYLEIAGGHFFPRAQQEVVLRKIVTG